jgi:hypothetical protein
VQGPGFHSQQEERREGEGTVEREGEKRKYKQKF